LASQGPILATESTGDITLDSPERIPVENEENIRVMARKSQMKKMRDPGCKMKQEISREDAKALRLKARRESAQS
jgi:hypothetical protein